MSASEEHDEYETKFDVRERFRLPDLTEVGGRPVTATTGTVHLESTYFDTDDQALLKRRVTVRRRTGDRDVGWQIKIPAGDMRTELHFPLDDAHALPDDIVAALAGLAPEGVRMRAVMRTERRLTVLADDGRTLAELAEDHVHVTTTGTSATVLSWRELEIEVPADVPHRQDVMAELGAAVRKAGAKPSASSSKLARALNGPGADVHHGPLSAYLREQADVIAAGDIALRTGPGHIHDTRVAVRRTRSVLRVFASLLPGGAAALDAELSWFQDALGAVRDQEVQRERLLAAIHALDDTVVLGPVAADIEQTLAREEASARSALAAAMGTPRYRQLQRDITAFTASVGDADPEDVVRCAHRARRTARRRLRAAASADDPVRWHRARKAIKRARYATELAAPDLGTSARRRIDRYKHAQDVLGDHQDCVVAADLLRRRGAATAGRADSNGFTYGLLYERETAQAARLIEQAHDLRI